MKLALYHWEPVTDCAKVMICLREMGLDFASEYVDILEFRQYAPEFLSLNPAGQVPVLVYGKDFLSESTLINEFLCESHPDRKLAPMDPKGWYETQCWGKYLDFNLATSVATLGWQATMVPVMRRRDQEPLRKAVERIPIKERQAAWAAAIAGSPAPEQLADSRRKIELAAKRIESTLAASPWLHRGQYSIVDIGGYALSATLPRLVPDIVNPKSTPRMLEWLERIGNRPAVREVMAMRKLAEPRDVYAPGPEHSRWG